MSEQTAVLDPATAYQSAPVYPATVAVRADTEGRNRLTTLFRFFLSIPHIIIVGGPMAVAASFGWGSEHGWFSGSGTGLLGMVAALVSVVGWFVILFTGRYPQGLRRIATYYLRWRVRAMSYLMLLRDEYPPFGDEPYEASLRLDQETGPRNRLTVAFRLLLAIPHLCILWMLGVIWAFTTAVAWVSILVTGRYPETLYGFALGVLAWNVRVESYMLLLRDEYPPFTLRV